MFYYEKMNYAGEYRPNITNGDKPVEDKTRDSASTIRCVKEVAVEHHMKSLDALQAIYGTLVEQHVFTFRDCPFCEGSSIQLEDEFPFTWAECEDCGARGPHTTTKLRAADGWNNR